VTIEDELPAKRAAMPRRSAAVQGSPRAAQTPILTITVNPALDVTATVPHVVPTEKLRCSTPFYAAGGGGVNVSRAIEALGGTSRAFVALGGATGEHFRQLLAPHGFDKLIWPIEGETRLSLDLLASSTHQQYRFLLPGPSQSAAGARALQLAARQEIARLPGAFVVISGTLLPGQRTDFVGRLAAEARRSGSRAILDVSGAALRAAVKVRPFLLRMNHLEAQELLDDPDEPTVLAHRAAQAIVAQGGAENVIVTAGDGGAVLAAGAEMFHFRPPRVEVNSAVGGGDSFTGALALGLARGLSLPEACRFGVAAAASAVTGSSTELCRGPQTRRFLKQVVSVAPPAGFAAQTPPPARVNQRPGVSSLS